MAWHDEATGMTIQFTDINMHLQGPLLLTWFNFNPSMDK